MIRACIGKAQGYNGYSDYGQGRKVSVLEWLAANRTGFCWTSRVSHVRNDMPEEDKKHMLRWC